MKIISLTFLDNYKQFKKGEIFNFSTKEHNETDPIISVLTGRNGSGKTTLMSLITNLFHYIERYRNKIPADFELVYLSHWENDITKVKLAHQKNIVKITIPGLYKDTQILPKKNAKINDYTLINLYEPYIEYSEIRDFLPYKVVSSTFSIHGEYPPKRPINYMGDVIVSNLPITDIYGNNHYKIGTISIGVLRFIKLFFENVKITELLKSFDLKFNNKILIFNSGNEEWIKIDKDWANANEARINELEIFINDIEFERNKRVITLSNMSSGEKMLLLRTLTILNSIEEDSLIIIEEPELHLDAIWNKQLLTLFKELFIGFNSHILIATHNYSIINSVPQNNIIHLENGIQSKINNSTFLASHDELFSILYGDDYKPNRIEEDFLLKLSQKNLKQLQQEFERVGNSIYKYLIFKMIKDKR